QAEPDTSEYDPLCLKYDVTNHACTDSDGSSSTLSAGSGLSQSFAPASSESFSQSSMLSFADDTTGYSLIHSGRLRIMRENKASKQIIVNVYGKKPASTDNAGYAVIKITSTGFVPLRKYVEPGQGVMWVNRDSVPRKIQSRETKASEGEFHSDLIPPNGNYTHNFTKEGVWGYRDATRTGYEGTIYVGAPGQCQFLRRDNFAKRFARNLVRPLLGYVDYPGRGEQIAASSPLKFFIGADGSISTTEPYVGGLGYAPGIQTGVTNQFIQPYNINSPANLNYWQLQQQRQLPFNQNFQQGTDYNIYAEDKLKCQPSGNSFTCPIPISPLLPTNGMAFSIVNDYALISGAPSNILIDGNSKRECLEAVFVDRQGIDGALVGVMQTVQSALGSAPRFSTFTVKLRSECVEYFMEDNRLKLRFKKEYSADPDDFTQTVVMSVPGLGRQTFGVTLKFHIYNDPASKYALQVVTGNKDMYSRISLAGNGAESREPMMLVNNLPFAKVSVGAESLPISGSTLSALYSGSNDGRERILPFLAKVTAGSTLPLTLTAIKDAKIPSSTGLKLAAPTNKTAMPFSGSGLYDVIGNPGKDEYPTTEVAAVMQCSGNNYCTAAQIDEAEAAVRQDIAKMREQFIDKIQEIDFNGIGQYAKDSFVQAFSRTLSEYAADQAQYRACKAMTGLLDLCDSRAQGNVPADDACSQGQHCDSETLGTAKTKRSEIWNIMKPELTAALCDSATVQQYEALVNSNNENALRAFLASRLQGVNFGPRKLNTKPIVDVRPLTIAVLFNRAADGADGEYGYYVKNYPLVVPGSYLDRDSFITLEQWSKSDMVSEAVSKAERKISSIFKSPLATSVESFTSTKAFPYLYTPAGATPTSLKANYSERPTLPTMNKFVFDLAQDKLELFDAATTSASDYATKNGMAPAEFLIKTEGTFADTPAQNIITVKSCKFYIVLADGKSMPDAAKMPKLDYPCSAEAIAVLKNFLAKAYGVTIDKVDGAVPSAFTAAVLAQGASANTLYIFKLENVVDSNGAILVSYSDASGKALNNTIAYFMDERFIPQKWAEKDSFAVLDALKDDGTRSLKFYDAQGTPAGPVTSFYYDLGKRGTSKGPQGPNVPGSQQETVPPGTTPSDGQLHKDAGDTGPAGPGLGSWQEAIRAAIPNIFVWDPEPGIERVAAVYEKCNTANNDLLDDNLVFSQVDNKYYISNKARACVTLEVDKAKAKSILAAIHAQIGDTPAEIADSSLSVQIFALDPDAVPNSFEILLDRSNSILQAGWVNSQYQGRFFFNPKEGDKFPEVKTTTDNFFDGGEKLYAVITDGTASFGRFWGDFNSKGWVRDASKNIITVGTKPGAVPAASECKQSPSTTLALSVGGCVKLDPDPVKSNGYVSLTLVRILPESSSAEFQALATDGSKTVCTIKIGRYTQTYCSVSSLTLAFPTAPFSLKSVSQSSIVIENNLPPTPQTSVYTIPSDSNSIVAVPAGQSLTLKTTCSWTPPCYDDFTLSDSLIKDYFSTKLAQDMWSVGPLEPDTYSILAHKPGIRGGSWEPLRAKLQVS
ncbi:MAG: hypothetical protein V1708_02810, partial [Candidatus Micrarchaeota archaeon]